MNSVTCFVGLDYHQDSVQVCVLNSQGDPLLNRSCRNDWCAIVKAVEPYGSVGGVAIEACGGSADLAEQLRDCAGWPMRLAHAGYVSRLKQSPDKSDYSDGRLLADLVRVGYLPKVYLATSYERDLRALVQHRQTLVDERRAIKQRIGSLLREQRAVCERKLSRWSLAWRAWARDAAGLSATGRWIMEQLLDQLPVLTGRIKQVEQQLEQMTASDAKVSALRSGAGIGPVTAWMLRAFIGRFDRFATGKQLSRYCGLSPQNASSGARQADAGLVRGCNKLPRATVIQAAHRLIRGQERWNKLAGQLRQRGKPASVAVAAAANRWMRGVWHRQRTTEATLATMAAA